MQVRTLIGLMTRIMHLMEPYHDRTVSEMLEDISTRLDASPLVSRKRREKSHNHLPEVQIELLARLSREEIVSTLMEYPKESISRVAKAIGLRVQAREAKNAIVELIASHFAYLNLQESMAQRNASLIRGVIAADTEEASRAAETRAIPRVSSEMYSAQEPKQRR